MDEVMEQNNQTQNALIDYRLSAIEKTLADMKEVLTEQMLQKKEISELIKNFGELKKQVEKHGERINSLERAPAESKAKSFETVVKLVLELLISACVVVVLAKIGLK